MPCSHNHQKLQGRPHDGIYHVDTKLPSLSHLGLDHPLGATNLAHPYALLGATVSLEGYRISWLSANFS